MAFCPNCGTKNDDGDSFCANCGQRLSSQSPAVTADSTGFIMSTDGSYQWYYELNMFKNPTILITLLKIFGGIVLGMGLFLGLLLNEDLLYRVEFILKFWLYGCAGALALSCLGYAVYAAIMGGKYCVVFEMDEKSVTHTQLDKQFKRAQVLAAQTTVAGAAKGSLGMTGTGILAGSRNCMETCFKGVSRIKVKRRRSVIYLKSAFSWNQIYMQPENFDTVLNFILEHIPTTAKRSGV